MKFVVFVGDVCLYECVSVCVDLKRFRMEEGGVSVLIVKRIRVFGE